MEGLESLLVFVVIVLLSALSNWLQHRKQRERARQRPASPPPVRPAGHGEAPPPVDTPPPPPPPVRDWEEELRRLLEGESEVPPRAPPPPPPVIVRETPPPPPPPVRPIAPVPAPAPTPPPLFRPAPAPASLEQAEAPAFELAPLSESNQAYARAAQLSEQVAARIAQAYVRTERPIAAGPVQRGGSVTPEVAALFAQLRHPRTARQAILASVVLGPPRGLES